MKKVLVVFLIILILIGLVACGKKVDTNGEEIVEEKLENGTTVTTKQLNDIDYNILKRKKIVNSIYVLESDGAFIEIHCTNTNEEDEDDENAVYQLDFNIDGTTKTNVLGEQNISNLYSIGVIDLDENDNKKELAVLAGANYDELYLFEIEANSLKRLYEKDGYEF